VGEPSFADVYNMLGVIYHDQGRYQTALRAFEAALRVNPRYTDAALNLAIVYNDTGKYEAAREAYQQALSCSEATSDQPDRFVKGKLANMYADIGDVWASSGKFREAALEYQRALDLCHLRRHPAKLAAAHRDAGERDKAIAEYEEIVRQNPEWVPARLSLGVALQAAGRKAEAVEQWNAVLRLSPGNRSAEIYLKLAAESAAT
jgi:tetratricopeptide (TPR) repeat protein